MEQDFFYQPFVKLGETLRAELRNGAMNAIIQESKNDNQWFTDKSIHQAIEAICTEMLQKEKLHNWLEPYRHLPKPQSKRIGIVMAGNIPAVGFFDLLCVLVCRHTVVVKPSSKDKALIIYIINQLHAIEPLLKIELIESDDHATSQVDALIATGNDLTRAHFDRHYATLPRLLRGSRTSLALLRGNESSEQLYALADDVFQYGGLGCRNVSRLLVPTNYDFSTLVHLWVGYQLHNAHYQNNYRQTRALRLLQGIPFIDGGFFLLRTESETPAALSEIIYTTYKNKEEITSSINRLDDSLQCIVGQEVNHPRCIDFGAAQHPQLDDYADGIDPILFLHNL